jgi:hypothetical protein
MIMVLTATRLPIQYAQAVTTNGVVKNLEAQAEAETTATTTPPVPENTTPVDMVNTEMPVADVQGDEEDDEEDDMDAEDSDDVRSAFVCLCTMNDYNMNIRRILSSFLSGQNMFWTTGMPILIYGF